MEDFPRFDLTGQTALVTGAARGLGRAISLALANAGADVALGLRDPDSGADLVDAITALGRRAVPLAMDVMHIDQIGAAVQQTVEHFGQLDILVNNAAGGGRSAPAEEVTEADYDLALNLNVKGVFFASQAAARVMIAQGSGRIVKPELTGWVRRPADRVDLLRLKAAVSHLTKCLAVEWGKYGITVNAVAPTFIRTPGTAPALSDPEFRADVVERIAALHRIGEPMDVAGAVVFLASPAASLITGTTLLVDGGWTAR